MKQITLEGFKETSKDYKSIIDGKRYVMYLDKNLGGTVLGPVNVINEKNDLLLDKDDNVTNFTYDQLSSYIDNLESNAMYLVENNLINSKDAKLCKEGAYNIYNEWFHILKKKDRKRLNDIKFYL